jgi:serine/threonine protein kinase
MRYYPDGSLASASTSGAPHARDVVAQAVVDGARAAHALHEVGIVHRDIKPANLLLAEGRGYLADLALAQIDTPGMTTTGIGPIGSVEYMEPDVVYGERAARASDIWSLAATLHRALTGRGIFGEIPQRSALEAFRYVLGTAPSIDPSIDGALRTVLERALAERRADRYPTAGDFAADLAAAEGCS